MAEIGNFYPAFDIQVTGFPICGSVTIEDFSVWPTVPPLYLQPTPTFSFDRTDVKLVVFWRDDVGVYHWDITDPNPGIWTIPGYINNGHKTIDVFAVPIAFQSPPGKWGILGHNNLLAGMVVFDPSDSNYYLTLGADVGMGTNYPSDFMVGPGPYPFMKIDDTVMAVHDIRNLFYSAYLQASTNPVNKWYNEEHLFAYSKVYADIYCDLQTFPLVFNVENTCTTIDLQNVSVVPSIINKEDWYFQWQNTAMAIFVIDGTGALVAGGYYSNLSNVAEDFSITVPGNGSYTVYTFLNEKYFSQFHPYVVNDIVYMNNDFVISDGAGNYNSIPFTLVGLQTFLDHNEDGAGWVGEFTEIVDITCLDENLSFETTISPECDFISFEDETAWPVKGGSWNRSDSGIAVFYQYNGSWFYDTNNFGTDLIAGEWLIPVIGNGIYTINAFCVPLWKDSMTHHQHSIVFYGGMFYLATAPHGAFEATPNIAAGWQLLTSADYSIFDTYWGGTAIDFYYGRYQTQVSINCVEDPCPPGVQESPLINSACHLYTLLNPLFDTTQNVVVKLYPLDMSEVISCQTIDVINGQNDIDITTPEDNVYVLQVGYADTDEDCEIDFEQQYMEYPIYDFCDAITCFMAMTKNIVCNELDPCCRNCDPEFLAQRQIFREELNKMVALFMLLFGYINLDNAKYLQLNLMFQYDLNAGIYNPIIPDRNILIGSIQDIINKLKDVTGRCGDCNGPKANTTKTPCENCGGSQNV